MMGEKFHTGNRLKNSGQTLIFIFQPDFDLKISERFLITIFYPDVLKEI